jgi:4-amino-4-deoxy-L-arabinose transferase-like glycosyltransferase
VLLGLILGVRVGYAVVVGPLETEVGDAVLHRALAASLAAGEGLCHPPGTPTLVRGPGLPALLAAVRTVTGVEALGLVVLLNALLFTLATWFTARIAAERGGWQAGIGALVVAGASPYALYLAARIYTEPLFLALLAAGLWQLQRGLDGLGATRGEGAGRRAAVAGGVLLGLATLTRAVSLYLLPVVLLWAWFGRGAERRERVLRGALACAAMALVFAPWAARNVAVEGRVLAVQGRVWFGAHNPVVVLERHPELAAGPSLAEAEREAHYREVAVDWIRGNLSAMPWLTWRKFVRYWGLFFRDPLQDSLGKDLIKLLGYKLFLPFLVLGALYERRRRRPVGVYLVLGYFVLIGLLTYGSGRMRAPAGPVWMAVAGVGLASAWRRVCKKAMATNGLAG